MPEDALFELVKGKLKTGGLPQFWKPQTPGEARYGRVVRVRMSPWKQGHLLYEIRGPDGVAFSTQDNMQLRQLFEDGQIKSGEFVYIRFEGWRDPTSPGGRKFRAWSLAQLTEAEAAKVGLTAIAFTPGIAESDRQVPPAAPSTPPASQDPQAELKAFVEQLFRFYPTLKVDEFNNYLNNVRKFNIPPEVAAGICNLVIVDGIVKKK